MLPTNHCPQWKKEFALQYGHNVGKTVFLRYARMHDKDHFYRSCAAAVLAATDRRGRRQRRPVQRCCPAGHVTGG